ncbi:hypothetical protein AAC387_Pa03g1980 [Persea americana]
MLLPLAHRQPGPPSPSFSLSPSALNPLPFPRTVSLLLSPPISLPLPPFLSLRFVNTERMVGVKAGGGCWSKRGREREGRRLAGLPDQGEGEGHGGGWGLPE